MRPESILPPLRAYSASCSTEARSVKASGTSTQSMSCAAITVADEKID